MFNHPALGNIRSFLSSRAPGATPGSAPQQGPSYFAPSSTSLPSRTQAMSGPAMSFRAFAQQQQQSPSDPMAALSSMARFRNIGQPARQVPLSGTPTNIPSFNRNLLAALFMQ